MNPETGIERPLPHSKEAEQFVLGCILVGNPKARSVFDSLSAADFFIPQNYRIFAALKALAEAGKPTDCLSALDELEREIVTNVRTGPDNPPSPAAVRAHTALDVMDARIVELRPTYINRVTATEVAVRLCPERGLAPWLAPSDSKITAPAAILARASCWTATDRAL